MTQPRQATADNSITVEITINAPAARVFEALVNPEQRIQWWISKGRFQATHMSSDLRPGGAFHMQGTTTAQGPEKPFSIRGTYTIVDPPRLLEFTWIPDFTKDQSPPTTTVRIELKESNNQTHVTLTHSGFTPAFPKETFRGWPLLLSNLQKYVQKEPGA